MGGGCAFGGMLNEWSDLVVLEVALCPTGGHNFHKLDIYLTQVTPTLWSAVETEFAVAHLTMDL